MQGDSALSPFEPVQPVTCHAGLVRELLLGEAELFPLLGY